MNILVINILVYTRYLSTCQELLITRKPAIFYFLGSNNLCLTTSEGVVKQRYFTEKKWRRISALERGSFTTSQNNRRVSLRSKSSAELTVVKIIICSTYSMRNKFQIMVSEIYTSIIGD